jgi:hypothetical protein
MTSTRTGWTIGGGVEWMFALHWSAFLEGNYIDFDNCLLRCMSPLMALSGQSRHRNILSAIGPKRTKADFGPRLFVR